MGTTPTRPTATRRHLRRPAIAVAGVTVMASATLVVPTGAVSALSLVAADATALRTALDSINAAGTGPHTITLSNAGPYLLDCGSNENLNVDGDLDVTTGEDVTITYGGAGRAELAVDQSDGGCATERVIDHRGSGALRLEHVRVADGDVSDLSGSSDGNGGGIRSTISGSRLELLDVEVADNRAADGGGGFPLGGSGGGLFFGNSDLEAIDSVVEGNVAGQGGNGSASFAGGRGGLGGGIASFGGNATLVDTVVRANRAGDGGAASATNAAGAGGSGGGIYIGGDLTMTGGAIGGPSSLDGNTAGNAGTPAAGGGAAGGGGGGAFVGGAATLTDVIIGHNVAGDATGSDGTSNRTPGHGGGLWGIGAVTLDGVTVADNRAGDGRTLVNDAAGQGGYGGGVYAFAQTASLSMTDVRIERNVAGNGGASTNGFGGGGGLGGGVLFGGTTLDIADTTFDSNVSGTGGTSDATFGGTGGNGGGLFVSTVSTVSAAVTIERTTFVGNTTGAGSSGSDPGSGAGLYASGADSISVDTSTFSVNTGAEFGGAMRVAAPTTITNSTFHGNAATAQGGAIYGVAGDREILASTFVQNGAPIGSALFETGNTATISRSVLAESGVTSLCAGGGTFVDGGDNVEHHSTGVGTCGFASSVVTTIDLGPLQDNGGPTDTILPAVDGVLVDAIEFADCVETADQRSVSRPTGSLCDIGAVELDTTIIGGPDTADSNGSPVEIDVLANDVSVDVPLDPASVTVSIPPSNGATQVNASTGVVTYTPGSGFEGDDDFAYRVCLADADVGDPNPHCSQVVVDVTVDLTDTTPDQFAFVDQTDVPTSSVRTSNSITVSGVDVAVPVSVSGGEFSVNGGSFTASDGVVVDGDTVRVRHTSSSSPGGSVDTTLTIGGVVGTFTSTTADVEPAPDGASRFVPLTPARLFDTRDGTGGVPVGKVAADGTLDVQVAGNVGVPVGAAAVVINITVDQPDGPAFVTAYPAGGERPLASTLNITAPGQVRPNLAIVPLSGDGAMSIYAQNSMHLLGDVAGYFEGVDAAVAAGRIVSVEPARVFDTRPGEPGNGPKGFVGPGGQIDVQVTGVAGVPDDGVAAVVLNVTATQAAGAGFVSVWPTGDDLPLASSLNLDAGGTAANSVMVPVGAGGQVSLYSQSGAHLLADVTGYVTDDSAVAETAGLFVPLDPGRVFDTRPSEPGNGPKGFVAAGSSITTQTGGVAGVPDDAAAVVLNVTATAAPTGFITVWPSGGDQPLASTLNLSGTADTRANAAIMPIGTGGGIDYFAQNGAHLIADTTGYLLG